MSPRTLPDDVIPAILCRLPVKDLLRYRSISKLWRSLIDGPHFIKLHLTHSHKNCGAIVKVRDRQLYWIHLRSPRSAAKPPNPIAEAEVIGCCNGLVALQNFSGDAAIWNPATRRHQRVPIPSIGGFSIPTFDELIGFGHDPATDDYKLVRMVVFETVLTGNFYSLYMLYSVKAKMWRRFKGQSSPGLVGRGHAFVRNAIHWIVITCDPDESESGSIFAFDITTEQFHEVPQPEYGNVDGTGFKAKLVELRGCLGLMCYHKKHGRYIVWTMKEYGVRESWTKLLSVGPTEMGGPFTYVEPVVFVRDQVLLEKDGDALVLYDLRSKSGQTVRISGVSGYNQARACVESLVRLNWDDGDSVEEKPKPKQSGKKRDAFLSKGFKLKL